MRSFMSRLRNIRIVSSLALCGALFPTSVLAIASYDAGAFFQFTNISADPGVVLDISVEPGDNLSNTSVTGGASADASSTPIVGPVGNPLQEVSVSGTAGILPGFSISSADAFNRLSIAALNTNVGGGTVDVVFDFIYGADVSASLDDLVNESVFASAGIFMDTVFGGPGTQGGAIIDETLDLFTAGADLLFNVGSYTLTLTPGEFNGVFVDLAVFGQAISISQPSNGVPLPASVALLALGLIAMRRRKRSAALRF